MIFPNKVVKFEDSVLGRITFLLDPLRYASYTVVGLFNEVSDRFEDINQYLLALDLLYLLDTIEFDPKSGVLQYVERTTM